MARTQLPMTNGLYESRSKPVSAQQCKNCYVKPQQSGLANEVLFGTAGLRQLASSGSLVTDANRGAHVMDGVPYFINDSKLYEMTRTIDSLGNENFALVNHGTITGTARVSTADNGTQLCILVPDSAGSTGYIYNKDTTTLTQITDVDFTANGNPLAVAYIDGYFVFTTDEKKFIVSALNDGLNYNALDFGSAEADPDKLVAPIVVNNELYICGSETIEPFRNAGGADFPFVRINGGVISTGVFGQYSVVNAAGTFFFVGGSTNEEPSIYAFGGNNVTPISNEGIDAELAALTVSELEQVFGFSFTQDGSRFVGWTLPNRTVVYDITSQRWHDRTSYIIQNNDGTEFRWRANSVVKAYNRILVGDNLDGRIGEMDLNLFSEYGNNIITQFSTMPFSNLGNTLAVPMLELTMEAGVGNSESLDPVVKMERSIDGQTWLDGRTRRIGRAGQHRKRTIWRKNGRADRFETFRFTVTDKVKKVFIKLEAELL